MGIDGSIIINMPPMPIKLQVISSVLLEDKVYISGSATHGKPTSSHVHVYSCENSRWSTLPAAPNFNATLSVVKKHITLIGGRDTEKESITNIVSTWSVEKQLWEQTIPPMPSGRLGSGVCYHDNLLLVTGGIEKSTEEKQMPGVVNTVHVYNFSTQLWLTPKALQLPKHIRTHQVLVLDEYIYLMGGATTFPSPPEEGEQQFNPHMWKATWSDIKESVNEAKTATEQDADTATGLQSSEPVKSVWTPMANPPALRPTVINCNNSLISVGGVKDGMPQSTIYVFINGEINNQWVKVGNMSVGRYRHAVVPWPDGSFGTALFTAGGYVRSDPKGDETNEKSSSAEFVLL